jgi:hypothetical protein
MDFCKTLDRLYAALRLRPFRGWLIRAHMERCPRCQARLLSREEAKGLLVGADRLGNSDALWQSISADAGRVASISEMKMIGRSVTWRWAAVTAMAAVIAVTGFWLLHEVKRPGFDIDAAGPVDRFEIDYINVGGMPARTFVYQPQGTETVFIWAQKTP